MNNTVGIHIGDMTLKRAADFLNDVFSEENYEAFRIGGDEFAVIAISVSAKVLEQKINAVKNTDSGSASGCSFSLGCATVNPEENNAMENAFIRADRAMYEEKLKTKAHTGKSAV